MDERKWFSTNSSDSMLDFLQFWGSGRKLRLFACAAFRSLWPWLQSPQSRRAVEVAESYADGLAAAAELRAAEQVAFEVAEVGDPARRSIPLARVAIAAVCVAGDVDFAAARSAALAVVCFRQSSVEDEKQQWLCDLVREVFGNPFRPVTLDPAWLLSNDGLAPRLAREIYDTRRFDELPVVADALEDAGCDHRELLDHLRRPGGHVRGCWALDAVLDLR
jgi:hypothetical protein